MRAAIRYTPFINIDIHIKEKPMHPELLTIQEFSKLTNTGITKIYAEINAGRLKAVKYGRCTRITKQAMQDWIENLPAFNAQSMEG